MDHIIPRIDINPINDKIDYIGNDFAIFDDVNSIPLNNYPSRVNGTVIAFCLNGNFNIEVNLKNYFLEENSFIITFPDQILQRMALSEDFVGHFMVISTNFMEEIFQTSRDFLPFLFAIKKDQKVTLNTQESEDINRYFEMIRGKVKNSKEGFKREITRGLIFALFYDIFNLIDQHSEKNEISNKTRKDSIYEKFMLEVLKNYKKERSVSFYADKLCLTAKHLSSVVKEVSGKTAGEWIDNFVILEARALLKSSDMSIQQIAEYLNFANQSFFGKYFKHYIGMSPKTYRKS